MTCKTILKSTALAAVLTSASAFSAQAVFFHVGSGSIDGSLCVGNDCVASPAFGFDTVILRENNLRMLFDDTSTAGSFPPNDWRLIANDSANGGSSHFSIEDATAGRQVFRVFAGARSNALVVDAQGDLGLGTATPATDIDIKTGNTPTVRLQQDGTSGFAPQTWDLAGNEAGFFIRDATNGSTLPFRIIPGASSNALVIDDDDDIGIGAGTNPEAPLHIERNDGTAILMKLENTNGAATGVAFTMEPSGGADFWQVTATANTNIFRINRSGGAGNELELDNNGNLSITGEITTAGSCSGGCDRVFDETYDVPSIEEHAALMWAQKHLPNVGPTPESGPVNISDKLLRMLNELEHAHIYIAELHERLAVLEEELALR